MSEILFPSLLHPDKTVFVYHSSSSDLWDQAYHAHGWVLSNKCGFYDTFGDGRTQHSPETVCGSRHFADFCASLATYGMANQEEVLPFFEHTWFNHITDQAVCFFVELKHNPDKRLFYNPAELKVSASDSRRHDKRWFELPSYAEGTLDSGIQLYSSERGRMHEVFERLNMIERFHDVYRTWWGSSWSKAMNDMKEEIEPHPDNKYWETAWQAFRQMAEMMRLTNWTKRSVEHFAENIKRTEAAA